MLSFGRRRFLVALASLPLLPWFRSHEATAAVPERLAPLIREVVGTATPNRGKVSVILPPLAESGNSIPLSVRVDSPMTETDYVQSIHVFAEKNPRPVIARFYLGPLSGRAEISTRIRLAGTQQVFVLAVMNAGTCWLGSTEVAVTAAACVDES